MLVFPRNFVDFPDVTAVAVRKGPAEPGTCLVEMEGDTVFHALDMCVQDPAVVADTGFGAGFSPAGDGFQDAAAVFVDTVPVFCQIFTDIDCFQHRFMSNGLVPDRKLEKDWKPAVSPCLVFTGTADVDMIPSPAPVCREREEDAIRTLGDHKECAVRPAPDHIPGLRPPAVCIFDEEVGSKAGIDHGAGRNPPEAFILP